VRPCSERYDSGAGVGVNLARQIGAWGRKHRGGGKVIRFFDAENGTEIDPLTIHRATGAPIGTRPIRIIAPE